MINNYLGIYIKTLITDSFCCFEEHEVFILPFETVLISDIKLEKYQTL